MNASCKRIIIVDWSWAVIFNYFNKHDKASTLCRPFAGYWVEILNNTWSQLLRSPLCSEGKRQLANALKYFFSVKEGQRMCVGVSRCGKVISNWVVKDDMKYSGLMAVICKLLQCLWFTVLGVHAAERDQLA
jgi:hypothetical protein